MFDRMRTGNNYWSNNVTLQISALFIGCILVTDLVQVADGFKLKFGHQGSDLSEGGDVHYKNVTLSSAKINTCEGDNKGFKCPQENLGSSGTDEVKLHPKHTLLKVHKDKGKEGADHGRVHPNYSPGKAPYHEIKRTKALPEEKIEPKHNLITKEKPPPSAKKPSHEADESKQTKAHIQALPEAKIEPKHNLIKTEKPPPSAKKLSYEADESKKTQAEIQKPVPSKLPKPIGRVEKLVNRKEEKSVSVEDTDDDDDKEGENGNELGDDNSSDEETDDDDDDDSEDDNDDDDDVDDDDDDDTDDDDDVDSDNEEDKSDNEKEVEDSDAETDDETESDIEEDDDDESDREASDETDDDDEDSDEDEDENTDDEDEDTDEDKDSDDEASKSDKVKTVKITEEESNEVQPIASDSEDEESDDESDVEGETYKSLKTYYTSFMSTFESIIKPLTDEVKPKRKPKLLAEKPRVDIVEEKKPEKKSPEIKAPVPVKKEEVKPKPKIEKTKEAVKTKPEKEVKAESKKVEDKKIKKGVKKDVKKKQSVKKIEHQPLTQRHFERLYYSFPTFAPNYSRIDNPECKLQGAIFIRQLKFSKLWALKMLDSTAKIPSGLLHGNLHQFGDYDQCANIDTKVKLTEEAKSKSIEIQGKYCLIYLDFESTVNEMNVPVNLAHAKNFVRSTYSDPGHFIPRFSTTRWGLCIPNACSAEDAELMLSNSLRPYNYSVATGLRFTVRVSEDECITKDLDPSIFDFDIPTMATIGCFSCLILLVVVASLKDYLTSGTAEDVKNTLSCFSLKTTLGVLLKEDNNPNEITCIHGIRSICTLMLYIAHKLIPLGNTPFTNRSDLTDLANGQWSSLFRGSLIYTDSFLLISGILSAYHMSSDMEKRGSINWRGRLFTRYIRLTPALAATVLFYAYIFELTGDGPLWNSVVVKNAELCKEGFWKNILYIQNFFPFENMCSTQTHQLALDMQLSLLSPILVWFWYKKPLLGLLILFNLQILSFGVRYYFTTKYNLSLFIFHGISLTQLYRTANKSYGQTLNRATPYLAGICLGVILQKISKSDYKLPKIISLLGWLLSIYFAAWTVYTPAHMAKRTYQYDVTEAAQYAAIAPVAWSGTLSWIIFYCFTNPTAVINRALSHYVMVLFSRISYAVYLVQFIVFFYNLGVMRSSTEFNLMSSLNLPEVASVIIFATIFTLVVDIPMQELKHLFMTKKDKEVSFKEETENKGEKSDEDSEAAEKEGGNPDDDVELIDLDEKHSGSEHSDHEEGEDSDEELIKKILELPVKDVKNLLSKKLDKPR